MPTYSLTSPTTGQSYDVDFSGAPSEADMEQAVSFYDDQFDQLGGQHPRVLNQSPAATAGVSMFRSLGDAAMAAVSGAAKLADVGGAQSFQAITGLPLSTGMQEVARQADLVQEEARRVYPTNPLNPKAKTVGAGLGQGAAMLATSGAAGLAGGGGRAMATVPSAIGFLSGAGEGIDTAREIGVSSPMGQLAMGLMFGGVEAGVEKLGGIGGRESTQMLMDQFRRPMGELLKQAAKSITSEGAEESVTGAAQDVLKRAFASEDPNNPGFTTTGVELPKLDRKMLEQRGMEFLGGAAGGTVFAGAQAVSNAAKPLQPASVNARTVPTPPADETVPDAVGGAGSTPAAGSPVSPLPGIAQRAGTVDVPPLVPGLEAEDIGPLTSADVQDLETIGQGEGETGKRQPILAGVPDRVAPFRDRPLNAEPQMSGDVITDLRIPRSPEAIAESQRIEQERQQQIAEMRMLDAKARGMPLIPDSPMGSMDILDWANENPIYLPPGFSEDRKLPEYESLKRNPLPNYWRQFVASGKQGGNPDSVAQRAYDAGLIAEPTADAYFAAVQEGIAARKQYRVQFQQRDKALAQEEKRVVDFEKSQTKLAKKPDTQEVPFEDIVPGDRMTIDGENAVVKNVEYNEDGYLTNVVIEDGKRFGLMQFDPQNRGGILVDEFKPQPRQSVEDFAPAEGVGQPMSEAPTRTTTTAAATPPRTAPAATPGRGEVGSGGAGGAALVDVAPSTRPRNRGETAKPQREDALAELGQATREGAANQAQRTLGFQSAQPTITAATLVRDSIHLDFDALARKPTREELQQAFPGAMIEEMVPDVSSATKGVVSFRVIGLNENGSMSSKAAEALYRNAFGTTDKIRTKSQFQQMGSLQERFAAGQMMLGNEVSPSPSLPVSPSPAGGFQNLDTSGRTAGFLNTQILAEAEALVRRGVRDFAAWSRAMIARFGEGIRAYLAGVWDNVRRNSQLGAVMNPFARGPLLAPASDMASTSGAAQNVEPSPGGLTEAEGFISERMVYGLGSRQAVVLYHGGPKVEKWQTNKERLEQGAFAGFHLTENEEMAKRYAANSTDAKNAVVTAYYARIPKVWDTRWQKGSPPPVESLPDWQAFPEVDGNKFRLPLDESEYMDAAAAGYDGVISDTTLWDTSGDYTGLQVVVFDPQKNIIPVNPESSRAAGGTGFQNLDTSGRTAGFLNTEILAEATALLRQGITDFTNWSRAMLTRFGRGIRDYLQGIWQQITSPQTNAAQNVRLGLPQGNAPVSVGSGGFVGTGQDVTRSRFANPEEGPNLYDVQSNEQMRGESTAWLDANSLEAALMALETNTPPTGLRIDHLPSLGSALIRRLTTLTEMGTEAQRLAAEGMLDRAGKSWHGAASQEAGRTLQQRAAANAELVTIAPVLAAKQVLVDRADRVMKERFTGGAEGATTKIKDTAKKADKAASEELAADLDAETSPGDTANPRRGAVRKKHFDLAKALNALRKKIAPGMKWADIFMELPETQKERQREIYRRLMLDQRLKALTPEERLALTNELDRAWQRERRKVFMRELEKITGLGKSKTDTEKVKKATPRLLRLMNLGMLNSKTFRAALAQEYGLKTLDAKESAELRKLGEDVQRAPDGLPRRKLAQQLIERLQALTGSTKAEILESWWTAAVLSGWRTQVDIALSVANGLEDVTFGSMITALRTGNGRVVKDAVMGMLSNLPTAMQEALDHVLTGNRSMMRNYDAEVKAALEDGNKLMGNVGRELIRKGGMARYPGAFMEFVSRLMTALDHINSTSTFQGAKAMALARHPDLYEQALRISPEDRAAARQQARLELTAGATPATRQQQLEETARMREILEARVPTEVIAHAREIGLEAALQGEPTGLGWFIYQVANKLNTTLRQATASYETDAANNVAGRTVLKALRTASTIVKVLTGTKFVRTVGHSVNRSLSYAPGLGLVRFAEGKMQGAKADILLAKQLIGTAVGLALLMALRDGEDDEQGIEGNWSGLTPAQKSQLMAEGKQPYTIWTRDSTGRIRSWNYQQWGLSGVLATLGSMEDQRRYNSQGKDDLAILVNGIITGSMAWTDKAQLTGLQMLMGKDQTGTSSNPAASMGGQLNKWAATTVGGLIPRITKDIDMVVSPTLRDSSEWWMKWAAQVPMLRETASGKRLNIFGEEIQLDRTPLSRVTQTGTGDPAYRTLGRLNERDIWLPDPSAGVRVVKLADGTRRPMTPAEKDRFQKLTGAAYKALIEERGQELLRMQPDRARDFLEKVTSNIRTRAAAQAVR